MFSVVLVLMPIWKFSCLFSILINLEIFWTFLPSDLYVVFITNALSSSSSFLPCCRDVYHCPSCNLCRLGKGLGVDVFHCMKCNCCLAMKLEDHKCLEKALETNCPICCEFLFTSSATVRCLPCGHYMHSACFQVLSFLNI